ncbi:hypothetical protein R2X28_18710 [Citrobacter freundii]|uniref:hypothetical protein n=1 Tax=Citrobacter freundii TaxID=546 RepID=UPI0024E0575D|nr:hypothetical protein [Citrobacter freundii]WOP97171.1 hypothetical protein R2X28_18710 [Citrobacter freundii]WOQ02225.1 hypothetical protein R2X29_18695 [Citrobacter freundii]
MKLFEMEGFLRGKCLPGDMKVNETNSEYLVRKFTELEQKLAESQREFRAADATGENLQMQVEKLAAENAGLKAMCEDRRTFIMNGVQLGYIQVPTVETDPALETIRVAVSPQEPTPATDAFLAEARAHGVELFAESQKEYVRKNRDELDSMTRAAYCGSAVDAERFAAQLRKGVQS